MIKKEFRSFWEIWVKSMLIIAIIMKRLDVLNCQLEIAKTIDFHDGTAIAIGNLSSIYVTLGQYDKSKEWILKKIENCRKLGSKFIALHGLWIAW